MIEFILTEPWAILLSGLATIAAALIVAIVGPMLLSKKFENLDDAADAARDASNRVTDRVATLDTQIGALERSLATVQNILNDFVEDRKVSQTATSAEITTVPNVNNREAEQNDPRREQLREVWNEIRTLVEDIASNSNVDGRTRAKYSRIDRRNYKNLLDELNEDQLLAPNSQKFLDAFDIWSRYRANRTIVQNEDLNKLQELRNQIQAGMARSQ